MSSVEPVILITGKNGQVGWELQRSVNHLGKVVAVGRDALDLSNPNNIRTLVREIKPDIILNAAAYTAVDKAEEERDLAHKINGIAPGILAEEANSVNALLVHYSTDYVFDGAKDSSYSESDSPDPINVYGESKLAGERAIKAVDCNHLIFRTSWVYASRGKNFLLSILRLASERDELNIVSDQIGSPTSARLIANVTAHAVNQTRIELQEGSFNSDLYHLVSSGKTSWHGFSQKIVETARESLFGKYCSIDNIKPIKTEAYPTPAQRPLNSCLSTKKLADHYGIHLSDWEQLVELCVQEIS